MPPPFAPGPLAELPVTVLSVKVSWVPAAPSTPPPPARSGVVPSATTARPPVMTSFSKVTLAPPRTSKTRRAEKPASVPVACVAASASPSALPSTVM